MTEDKQGKNSLNNLSPTIHIRLLSIVKFTGDHASPKTEDRAARWLLDGACLCGDSSLASRRSVVRASADLTDIIFTQRQ